MSILLRSTGRPYAASRLGRFAVLALAAVAAAATAPVLFAAPASAVAGAGTPPYWADSVFNVPSGTGASVPFTEYQAVNASTNGSLLSPSFAQGSLASEAVGREAIQLTAANQYVTFTVTTATNAIDLHYAVPQGDSGTLEVLVNGAATGKSLSLTSAYSYITTSDITGSDTHDFYDDARLQLGQTVAAGGTVTVEVTSSTSDLPVTVNVLDGYDIAAAATQPADSVSVVTEGADPTGANNSQNAFNEAITAANAAGETVWVPSGTYLISSPLQITSGTIAGAGDWYTQIETNELVDNTSDVAGPINLSNFAILGSQVGRNDNSVANAIDGSLGTGWTVNGLWIQDTNVGLWLQYGNSNCTVENSIVQDTDADGLNFNGNASGCTVKNNYFRNTGDDSIAIWSYPATDSNITIENNTVDVSTLANGIAEYGGTNNTVENNVVADTNALGSGLDVANEQFLSPGFTPLTGTITISGNYLIRTGAYNPNWGHAMGALQFDAYDYAFSGVTINYSGGAILDSPYSAIEFVSGGGSGYAISGVNISNLSVENTGTTVLQAETPGSASISGLAAGGIGVAGSYNYDYPGDTAGALAFNLGSGNTGWSTSPVLTSFPQPVLSASLTASAQSLSFGSEATGSTSAAQTVAVTNQSGTTATVSSISTTGPFNETNSCGSSIAAGGSCTVKVTFAPTGAGAATGTLSVNASTPGSPLTVALSGTGTSTGTSPEAPYGGTPAAVPGTVYAANYDTGGQGVAYNVTSVNGSANSYRSDGVDLETTSDTSNDTGAGVYDQGWTASGQWFKYTVNVATAGTYNLSIRLASPSGVTDALHIDNSAGTDLSGLVNAPDTGGWQDWATVTASVTLPAGVQTLTVDQDNAGWNIHYLTFAQAGLSTTTWYEVVNANSGLCATAASTANGTAVEQEPCTGATTQLWEFTPAITGYYEVLNDNAQSEGESWNIAGGVSATASGDLLQTWNYGGTGNTNALFSATLESSGYYNFIADNSGLCIDTPGASTTAGVQLQQYTCNSTAAQEFTLTAK